MDFDIDLTVIGLSVLIFIARICDVSIGTVKTVTIVNGHRIAAWWLCFFEVLVWVFAVSKVIQDLDKPIYAISFALGAATGNYVGITIEKRLAYGHQIVRVFTRAGDVVADALRTAGHRVTEIDGKGRDGPIQILFIEVRRRNAMRVVDDARRADPDCYYILDDIRLTSALQSHLVQPTGWRAVFKKK